MLTIRKVEQSDSEIIWKWRNRPEIYKYALNPAPIARDEHEVWFVKTLSSPHTFFYLALYNNTPCGSVRYQKIQDEPNTAEVSISIDPDFWGKKIATSLMAQAEEKLKEESDIRIIKATVLNANKASMALFTKSSFIEKVTVLKKEI